MQEGNKLIVSVAGSGKTTFIVNQALSSKDKKVLLTTYTQANKDEIISKIIELNGVIPSHIEVETWFSFLFRHGVKPYQGSVTAEKIKGIFFVSSLSGMGIPESNIKRYYFCDQKIYSDKLSKFVVRSDDATGGSVISRLSRIYDAIYIDEAQDMCGYDLDILSRLFDSSMQITLVADPRQATYTTHPDKKYTQYKKGGIINFIQDKCPLKCEIDYELLKASHRNHESICTFSSLIFPEYEPTNPCGCSPCRTVIEGAGVFLVAQDKIIDYVEYFSPVVLRQSKAEYPEWNFGQSKGKTFPHTLIYPSAVFEKYLIDGQLKKEVTKKGKRKVTDCFDRSKLYVAATRARYSVGIICTNKTLQEISTVRLTELGATIY